MMISGKPEATASSTTYWIVGLSTSGNISLGCAFVAGRNRVPRPAAGNTPLRTCMDITTPRSHADRGEALAIERRFDPTSQVVFGVEPAGGVYPNGKPKDRIASAESHNTLHRRRVQRSSRLARPRLARFAHRRQGAVDVDVARHADLDDCAPPAHAEVRELGERAVRHDPDRAVLQAQLRHAQPDRLHGAGDTADLDDVTDRDQTLEEQEDAREQIADQRLRAEADDDAEHAGRDHDGLHVDAKLAEDHHEDDEGERPAHDAREQGAECPRARSVAEACSETIHEAVDQPLDDVVPDEQQSEREPDGQRVAEARAHRPRPRAMPSSTAMIASTQPAWMSTSTASCFVASLSSMADRPSVAAMKRMSSTVSVRVRPSDSNR